MANTLTAEGLAQKNWRVKFWNDYQNKFRFKPFLGKSSNSMIQVVEDLQNKQGKSITLPLVNELMGDGITGDNTLRGNETPLNSRSFEMVVDQLRNAVTVPKMEGIDSAIPLYDAARGELQNWMLTKTRLEIIAAMHRIDGVDYADASEVQKDAWLTNNADRVLFGAAKSNNAANDHSVALANVDATADKLTAKTISLAKRMAKTCTPLIRPTKSPKIDEDWFVLWVPPLAFRDIQADLRASNRDGWLRGANNPIFRGGDLISEGVIIKELEEIPILSGVGAAGIDVAPCFMMGGQALAIAWRERTRVYTEKVDYTNLKGVAIGEIRKIDKVRFGTGAADTTTPKDHGVLTMYVSGVADA